MYKEWIAGWFAVIGMLTAVPAHATRSACTATFNTSTGSIELDAVDVGTIRYVVKLDLLQGGTVPRYRVKSATATTSQDCMDAASVTGSTLTIPDISSGDSFFNATLTLASGTGQTQIDFSTSSLSSLLLDLISSNKNPRLVPDAGFRVQGASNPFATFNAATGVTYLGYQSNNGAPQAFQSASDGLGFSSPTVLTYSNRSVDSRRTLMPDGLTWRLYQISPQGVMTSYISTDGNVFSAESGTRYSPNAADNGSIGVYDLYTAPDGALILIYLGDLQGKNNLRMAKSMDNGVTFTYVKGNVLGDDTNTNGKYVDNKTIRLADGRYRMITMRNAQLQSFVTTDGYNWTREAGTRISEKDFASVGVTIYSLNDPVAILDNTGAIKVYVSAETTIATTASPIASSSIVSATWNPNVGSGTLAVQGASSTAPVCTLRASTAVISVGSTTTLTASCIPSATTLTWGGTGFGSTSTSGNVAPVKPTMYSVVGTNSVGSGAAASAAVYVCNTSPSQTYPGISSAGTSTSEQFASGISNDIIDGAAGVDTVIYNCNRSSFTLTKTSTGWTVSSAAEGLDTLTNVERIRFGNETLALDITGNAGQAYRIYQAAFNRVPDNGGLKFWIGVMDGGLTLREVAAAFMTSDEFKTQYGANPKNEDFVTKLYTNILHRTPDAGGYAYWVNALNTKVISQAEALVFLSESTENQAGVINAIINGIDLLN